MFDVNRFRRSSTIWLFDDDWDDYIVYEVYAEKGISPKVITDDITKLLPVKIKVEEAFARMVLIDLVISGDMCSFSYTGDSKSFHTGNKSFHQLINYITDSTHE